MADQTVRIESDSDKFRVAYDMAKQLWLTKHDTLSLDDKGAFLDLVQECIQSLNGSIRRAI